jgi:predicted alpha/beta-fold hydrolase
MKKILIVFLFILSLPVSASFTKLEKLSSDLEKHKPPRSLMRYRNGLLSTVVMGSSKENIDLSMYSKPVSSEFSFGKHKIKYRYSYLYRSKDKPLIIALSGYRGDLNGVFTKVIKKFSLQFTNYNILILEALTSIPAITRNKHMSLGGLHEAQMVLSSLEHFEDLKVYNASKVVLIAGSSSTFGAYYGSVLLNKKYTKKMGGLLLLGAFNNMSPVVSLVEALDFQTNYVRAHNYGGFFFRAIQIYFRSYMRELNDINNFNDDSYFRNLEKSFTKYKIANENHYYSITNKYSTFNNNFDYYNKINLCGNFDLIDFPLYWIHATDDPISKYWEQYRAFHDCAKSNEFIIMNGMLRNGGHAGYSLVYGNDWLRDEASIFLNGVLEL